MSPSFEVNPATSTLVELTQKFSGSTAKKAKDGVRPEKLTSKQNIQKGNTDTTNLSDDMLGDMDPDEYRGKDHSADFKKHMQAWREEAEKTPHDEEKEEGEEGSGRQDKGENFKGSSEEEEEARKEAEREKEEAKAIESRKSDGGSLSEEARTEAAQAIGENTEKKQDNMPRDEPSGSTGSFCVEKPEDGAGKSSAEWGRDRPSDQEERTKVSDEKSSVSRKHQDASAGQESGDSGFVSLLGFDEGFIIADPRKKTVSQEEAITETPRAKRPEVEAAPEISATMEERYRKVFQDLILAGVKDEAYQVLSETLRGFGVSILEVCRDNGERVLLLPKSKDLSSFHHMVPGIRNDYLKTRFGYFPLGKLVVLSEEVVLGYEPRFDLPTYYFSFAFDHSMGGEYFASERSPAVLANYQACRNREPGHQFVDNFSSISPAHYFAQSVESYLTPPRSGMEDSIRSSAAICTCEELYDIDRSMYMYLDYLFKKMNKGPEIDPYVRMYKFSGIV